ncbi:MAG: Mur ligase family protein, partial [Sphingomonadaceae bacterium]
MGWTKSYFFCGIGGSGMLPLATILKAQGHEVSGSDRALDQGRSEAKFDWLAARGMKLFPQDGSGISGGDQILVASAAVEEHVPDGAAAARLGCARTSRAALLAGLFNAAPQSVAVGGTSGKSTVTGMLGWIAHRAGRDPTIMNGAVMRNFVGADTPFASSIVGGGGLFVSEVDESDGSIALFDPAVAVLNNVSIDHKPIDELRGLFGDFLKRARRAVVNIDDPEAAALAAALPAERLIGFGFSASAHLRGAGIEEEPLAVAFTASEGDESVRLRLGLPGRHNAANALAALAAAQAAG